MYSFPALKFEKATEILLGQCHQSLLKLLKIVVFIDLRNLLLDWIEEVIGIIYI